MNVIVFNTPAWDRTINALWKSVKLEKNDNSWLGFRMPEDFECLTSFLREHSRSITSLSLLGSFYDWPSDGEAISIKLKEIFTTAQVPRIWLMLFDLHHTVSDLLHGRKTRTERDIIGKSATDNCPKLFFDCLAWHYEHVNFDEAPDISLFKYEGQYLDATRAFALAQNTWLKLSSCFPNRFAFYHCLEVREITKSRPSNFLRIFDLGIPGSLYATRIRARAVFLKFGYSITPSELVSKLFGKIVEIVLKMLKLFNLENEERARNLKRKLAFSKLHTICQLSKFVWVDGGHLRYPVRKYFEIPALNAVLVSPKDPAIKVLDIFENWQLIDLEHLSASTLQLNGLGRGEKIRLLQGQKTKLMRFHTAASRLQSLALYADYYQRDSSLRGHYDNGKLIFERNGKLTLIYEGL